MKNVWLIHNAIPPYRVPLFAEIAERADFDFSVVLTAPECRHRPHWTWKGDDMPFRLIVMKGLNIGTSHDGSLSISYGLLGALFRRRPDIVICSGFGLSTLFVYVYAKVCGKKYIIWSEATETTERVRGVRGLRRRMRRLLATGADAFVDAGMLSRDYIMSLLPPDSDPPVFRSYNCVDDSLFSSDAQDPCPADGGRDSKPSRRILFVGRLNANKGIPMLLDVYRDVLDRSGRAVGLVLVGEGPLLGAVEDFQRSNSTAQIELMGQLPYAQVASHYRACDVFVLLSASDCNPLVIFEALHSGIPIICTDRAGNAPDFIVPGENGYIVDPTDKDRIVECVLDVLQWDREKQRRAADVSQERVAVANYPASARAFIQACAAVSKTTPVGCPSR
jgi:glycosyltransferase involved in cell wall biosynthesis